MKSDTQIKTILFGASNACANFLQSVNNSKYQILAIADNEDSKSNQSFMGYKVISPKEILSYNPDKIIITSSYANSIYKQLTQELKIKSNIIEQAPKNQIISGKNKGVFENEETRLEAEEILQAIINILNKNKITYFIDHGTLLGIIREQRVMPWDDDIDITIYKEEYEETAQLIKENLHKIKQISNKNIIVKQNILQNNIRDIKIIISKNKEQLYDITIKTINFKNGEALQSITKSPDIHFLKNDIFKLWSLEIKVPHKPEEYLTVHYGDWKTPKKNTSFLDLKNYVEPIR